MPYMNYEAGRHIALDQPFGYAPEDISKGLQRVKESYEKYKEEGGQSGIDPQHVQFALESHQRALTYAEGQSEEEIIATLRGLHQTIATFEGQGLTRAQIVEQLTPEQQQLTATLHTILDKGWIESLYQGVTAAWYRQG